jgi:hypothetical protein
VKPNRHLGDMSAVKTVPEKQREVCVPKVMKEIRSMSPSNLTNPVTCCKTTTMEMCSWKMGQQRKRSKALNRKRPATKTTTPRKELTGEAKDRPDRDLRQRTSQKRQKIGQGSTRSTERIAMETEEK